MFANLINSGVADKAALWFLFAAALPILLAISNALTGLLASCFPKSTVTLPILLEKSVKTSASIVASLTVIDLFLLPLTQLPLNILIPFEVTTPLILLVPLQCLPPTQYELVLYLIKLLIFPYIKIMEVKKYNPFVVIPKNKPLPKPTAKTKIESKGLSLENKKKLYIFYAKITITMTITITLTITIPITITMTKI